jgi:tetraacyldisaccharide 4'-kinase
MSGGFKLLQFLLLYPFSLIYRAGIGIRNVLYEAKILKSKAYNIPIISVGNIAVGGTGKTPHVEYILNLLNDKYKTAMLSRGYRRKTKGFVLSGEGDTAKTIGDEPYQIKSKFKNVIVAVDGNRQRGIENLLADKNLKAIILDDAFQHRKVLPGLNIILTEFERPFTKDSFLPYGRLREHPLEHRRAHIIIVTKCPQNIKPIERRIIEKEIKVYPFQYLFFTSFQYENPINIFDSDKTIKTNELQDYELLAVSAIANNSSFVKALKTISKKEVTSLGYFDHHYYSAKDISKIQESFQRISSKKKLILTTEKDAVKLRNTEGWDDEIKDKLFYIPVKVVFLGDCKEEYEFQQQIIKYVTTNRRYSKLYKGQY